MADPLVFSLRHDLQLTITGQPTLRALGNFLKAAIVHFKNQRDIQKAALYKAGSFQGRLTSGDCAISNPGDSTGHYLAPGAWAEAVIDAFSRLTGLEQMLANQPAAQAIGGDATGVPATLEHGSPADHLAAFGLLLQPHTAPPTDGRPSS